MARTTTSWPAFELDMSLLTVAPLPMEASVVFTPTPADKDIAMALSDETAPDAAMEITS